MAKPKQAPFVAVVDDDDGLREAIMSLLESEGIAARGFGTPDAFLKSARYRLPACLVLDIQLPGMSGLDLRERLLEKGIRIPTILITARSKPAQGSCLQASQRETIALLRKPFAEKKLLRAVRRALAKQHAGASRRAPGAGRGPKVRRAGATSRVRS